MMTSNETVSGCWWDLRSS